MSTAKCVSLAVAAVFGGFVASAEGHATGEAVAAKTEGKAGADAADGAETEITRLLANPDELDLAAAETIFRRSCRACHGNKGQGASSYPKINDKEPDYIAEKLELYRAGTRIGPNSILMIQASKKLSDDEIAALAVYVATAFD